MVLDLFYAEQHAEKETHKSFTSKHANTNSHVSIFLGFFWA